MNAGLPGVGIGGLFYLLCALLMPFVELGRTFAGRSSAERWRSVAVQFVMALAMVATVTAVIWGVRVLFSPTEVVRTPVGGGAGGPGGGGVVEHVVRVTPHLPIALVLLSYLMLGVVLLVATVLRYVVRRRPMPVTPLQPRATTHFAPPPVPTVEREPSRV
jgi:hypothetical protein